MGRDLEAPATAFEVGTSSAVMEEYFPSFAASGSAPPCRVARHNYPLPPDMLTKALARSAKYVASTGVPRSG